MKTAFNFTGTRVRYENGKEFGVHTKITKKGLRYYKYVYGRFLPISKIEVEQRTILI
jgi:hypothetical protein